MEKLSTANPRNLQTHAGFHHKELDIVKRLSDRYEGGERKKATGKVTDHNQITIKIAQGHVTLEVLMNDFQRGFHRHSEAKGLPPNADNVSQVTQTCQLSPARLHGVLSVMR